MQACCSLLPSWMTPLDRAGSSPNVGPDPALIDEKWSSAVVGNGNKISCFRCCCGAYQQNPAFIILRFFLTFHCERIEIRSALSSKAPKAKCKPHGRSSKRWSFLMFPAGVNEKGEWDCFISILTPRNPLCKICGGGKNLINILV